MPSIGLAGQAASVQKGINLRKGKKAVLRQLESDLDDFVNYCSKTSYCEDALDALRKIKTSSKAASHMSLHLTLNVLGFILFSLLIYALEKTENSQVYVFISYSLLILVFVVIHALALSKDNMEKLRYTEIESSKLIRHSVNIYFFLIYAGSFLLTQFNHPEAFNRPDASAPPLNSYEILYYCVSTITTVGYGDITAKSFEIRLISNVIAILGIMFLAYSFFYFSVSIQFNRTARSEYRENLHKLYKIFQDKFFKVVDLKEIPPNLTKSEIMQAAFDEIISDVLDTKKQINDSELPNTKCNRRVLCKRPTKWLRH